MKANLTLGQRISLGFSLLLLITSVIGGVAAWQMRSAASGAVFLSVAVAPQATLTSRLSEASATTQLAVRTYSLTGDEAQLKVAEEHLGEVQADLDACRKLAAEQPSLVALAEGIKQADAALAAYREGLAATVANQKELLAVRAQLDAAAGQFSAEMDAYSQDQNKSFENEMKAGAAMAKLEERRVKLMNAADIEDLGNRIRITNYKAQALRDPELIEKVLPDFAKIRSLVDEILAVTHQEKNIQQLNKVRAAVDAYEVGLKAVMQNYVSSRTTGERRAKAAAEFDAVVHSVLDRSITRTSGYATESAGDLTRSASVTIWGLVGAVIAGVVASVLIVRSLVKLLTTTSETLAQGTLQISAATGQVSSASQTLAEGASEQAASLEEISSSLEELSSTTKHNAENANSAKQVADRARVAAEQGAEEMDKMDKAMTGIRESSNEISKIIKTIDEIAFQTNILALNAAVEAARAGEAGAGFAVVAEEVRTLAQRCATAARETTEKISDATTRSELGANLTRSVAASLQEIVTQAREVDRLVADVANASREQSAGLAQVNTAVSQMDKVTQGNAASAEETASAAEEMNAQTQELQHSAQELAALVGIKLAAKDTVLRRAEVPVPVRPADMVPAPALVRPAAVVRKPAAKPVRVARATVEADAHFV